MKVIHIKNKKGAPDEVYIGRGSVYGNPFKIDDQHDRLMVVQEYKKYFWQRINTDKAFYDAVMRLKDKTLVCFCAPLSCHGDVIKAWFEAGCPVK